ncbi:MULTISPECIES: hypothetical protein [unclassified Pseudovibrio]|uniref:hypothetical protein n=1 Tax=unclassified Pseudovibrio TaxID=2627060 RepID=UPI0007AEB4FE|nr:MULTISPECIES: hypothetical protein [unclassified Pseudovibrio]KZL01216.1 hypothetical protein PsW74_02011 [Pseudovibrio sp. W74]KZL11281.1 hypothetical protein PsAD14_01032 [Pseudovibrio sp. Ad14]
MKSFLALPIIVFLGISHALAQQATYVENRFKAPLGPYFIFDQSYYRVKGSEQVGGLGTYGRVTGKGWLGPFIVNGFKANGKLGIVPELNSRSATASGKTIMNAFLNGNVSGETLEGDAVIQGDAEFNVDLTEDYTVIVVRPDNWDAIYKGINQKYETGDIGLKARFQDPKFRVVDTAVYATNLKIEKIKKITGSLVGKTDVPKLDVVVELEGDANVNEEFELTGKQIIAYSYRRLCWVGETIVEAREDNPGVSDMSNCDNY